ncbi:Ral guanine nucleotide dissociation stimulator-like 1 [Dissostichus eleginoides]|uniref:Ral guanine nucleotide dissociation stimulator-like 1 n=1 Tax=Dissostichus eleginoides TaxID=100907 RepID=A0AAD9F5G3_DISEL|nr:Ral guanine nucleotide dissociation stimulator-like 1 [Dissostichus eleginoides]
MRTFISVGGGADGGDSRGLRSRVGRMKKLLWTRPSGHIHTDTEPGVWLTSFQSLDTDGQLEDQVQEWGEEVEEGAVFGITLRREPVLPSSEPTEPPTAFSFAHYHTESDYMRIFLSTYRAFTPTSTLIELLFQREDSITNLDNTVCPRSTLPPVIRLWLRNTVKTSTSPPSTQPSGCCVSTCAIASASDAWPSLQRLSSRGCRIKIASRLRQNTASGGQLTRLDAELFVQVVPFHCLGCVWSQRDKKENRNLAPSVRATISQFNAVTNRVITSLLWTASPCPSTSSPISSHSSDFPYPSTAPILHSGHASSRGGSIAQECHQLKNFSSLRAILSALQSNAVYRLKKTWAAVSRESMNTFDHLCETFPDENCVLTSREILVEDGNHSDGSATPSSVSRHINSSSGVVPYLGTYLTVLTMLDTALTDTVEGGLINFEKRRREFEILSQIRQLQASCSHYSFPVNPLIAAWLQAHTLLTDQESYELSRELEPPVDPCPSSPNSWSSRLLTKKLASLRTSSESSLRKTHADQISVSSSGSSSSDMEDLSAPQPSPLRLKLKTLSGSLHNVAEDFSSSSLSSSSPSLSSSSSHPDLSSSSLGLSPESSPQAALPVYNKQVADSCIVRVSVESVSNGNVYKSILLTSQDHTPQVIQRAVEKHNMEDVSCCSFNLCQMLSNGKELQIPEKANVFYAMCTSANYDFVLRQRWRSHGRRLGSSFSPGAQPRSRHGK